MEHLNKVARITFLFWLMKIIAATLGDYISITLDLGTLNASVISIILMAVLIMISHINWRKTNLNKLK